MHTKPTIQTRRRSYNFKYPFSWMQAPDRREIYYSPQILNGLDGEQSVLFGTGGSERSGALFVISITDLYRRDVSKVSN